MFLKELCCTSFYLKSLGFGSYRNTFLVFHDVFCIYFLIPVGVKQASKSICATYQKINLKCLFSSSLKVLVKNVILMSLQPDEFYADITTLCAVG